MRDSIRPLESGSRRARIRLLRLATTPLVLLAIGCDAPSLEPWHQVELSEEFTATKADAVGSFAGYLQLEDRLFAQLEDEVNTRVGTGPTQSLVRYSTGSAADPLDDEPNWNRSFELVPEAPVGGVLLLHGMSDSPYSLRALAEKLVRNGYQVIGLRLPGHGTAPSGLKFVSPDDMIAAVRLAMVDLSASLGERPIHMVGYSTGAPLALDFSLEALEGNVSPLPASLVLISPAIRVHPAAALARFNDALSAIPGLGSLAWLSVLPEFDPYKYNSFATNAGHVVHRLTRSVDQRIAARSELESGSESDPKLPPILVFKSTVDTTVTTEAVVDNLLARLAPHRHELVLFDINRSAAKSMLLTSDPAPLTDRLLADDDLPFDVRFITNENPKTGDVVALHKAPFTADTGDVERLGLAWPRQVMSLSHIALPIPPDDPLYGRTSPESDDVIFLGEVALRGERGLLVLPDEWMLRMRYNPFYEVLERRVLEWFEKAGDSGGRPGGGANPGNRS
jgi:alpha-beta hydrolase superfamily lysophospholipase